MKLNKLRFLLFFLLIISLGGCASVSVSNLEKQGVAPKSLPKKIFVQEFSIPKESFYVGRQDEALEELIRSEKHALAVALSKQITKRVSPCEVLTKYTPLPKGDFWVLQGKYLQVYQGSRALRILIGFGAGKTTIEMQAVFCSMATGKPTPFLSVKTTGGSGLSPGVVGAMNPGGVLFLPGAVGNALGASLGGLSVDRNRSAREMTAALSDYCYQQNILSKNRLRRPKMLRKLPALQWPELSIPFINP